MTQDERKARAKAKWAAYKAAETPEQRARRLASQRRANQKRREKLLAYMKERMRDPANHARKLAYMREYNARPDRKTVQKRHNDSEKHKANHAAAVASGRMAEYHRDYRRRKAEAKALTDLARLGDTLKEML